mgnify:CR=1 FL=1
MSSQSLQKQKNEKTLEEVLLTPSLLGIYGRNYILNDDFVHSTVYVYEGIAEREKALVRLAQLSTEQSLEKFLYETFKPFIGEYTNNNVVNVTPRETGIERIDPKNKTRSNVVYLDVFMHLHLDKSYNDIYKAFEKHLKSDNKDLEARYFWL